MCKYPHSEEIFGPRGHILPIQGNSNRIDLKQK